MMAQTEFFAYFCIQLIVLSRAASPSIWVKISGSKVASEGETKELYCLHAPKNDPVNVKRWTFQGLDVNSNNHVRIGPSPTRHRLTITSVRPSDSGAYTCATEIKGSEVTALSVHLKVYGTIIPYDNRLLTFARVGSNATLTCDGENYQHIVWWRKGKKIAPEQAEFLRFKLSTNGSQLHITGVEKKDNGTYRCQFVSLLTAYLIVRLFVQEELPQLQGMNTVPPHTPITDPTTDRKLNTTSTPDLGKIVILSMNRTEGSKTDPTITVPRVFLSTLPPVVLTDKMLVSTTSFYVNVTTEQVSQKDVSYPPNENDNEMPKWVVIVIPIAALCGILSIGTMALVKIAGSWKSRKETEGDKENPCPKNEGMLEQSNGDRISTSVVIYETIDEGKRDSMTTCPDSLTRNFVKRDSNGYVIMEAYNKQQDDSRKVSLPTKQSSSNVTADSEYVEMKQKHSGTEPSAAVIVQKDEEEQPENSCYVNVSSTNCRQQRVQSSTKI